MNLIHMPDSAMSAGPTMSRFIGPIDAPIMVVVSSPAWDHTPLSYAAQRFWNELARQAGLSATTFQYAILPETFPPGRHYHNVSAIQQMADSETLAAHIIERKPKLIVPLDDEALFAITGHESIEKWSLSIVAPSINGLSSNTKVVPLHSPEYIFRAYSDLPFLIRGMVRLKEELSIEGLAYRPRTFLTEPTFKDAMDWLRMCYKAPRLGIDIETAHGQITCAAFAVNPDEGMSIPLEPKDWASADEFHAIWNAIYHVMMSPAQKVMQNGVAYDAAYFARYGIPVNNMWMDTMLAQRFLFPELSASLATIAKLWTREPYWKDEGRKWKPEDGLEQYYRYNIKDTLVMLEAAEAMERELTERGLMEPFQRLVMSIAPASTEMCWHGLPIDNTERLRLLGEYTQVSEDFTAKVNTHAEPLMGKPLNPRSPKQIKEYLTAKKYRLPTKKGKETSDVTALLKLQVRYPNDPVLPLLIQLSETNKAISSYLKVEPEPDGHMRFSRNLHGAMTGRRSCSKTPWDKGWNAQTLPSQFKSMVKAPPGWTFAELDLKQADARVVAWSANEQTLMDFFRKGKDIHKFVAAQPELFNKALEQITKDERQLGKKTGHAANYGMMGATHSEACLREMGLVISVNKAQQMLDGYHRIFPGIRIWHQRIQDEVRRTKRMRTPLGREWLIYGRLDDATFRQCYAYEPQSTVADVINCLITHMDKERDPSRLIHLNEIHDSYVCMIRENYLDQALELMRATSTWNPVIPLAGGPLTIPVELKVGHTLASMEELFI